MKKFTFLLLCLFSVSFSFAQQKAVTETGDEVVLYSNGTWKYLHADSTQAIKPVTNPHPFTKNEQSTFLIKSKNLNVGFWINPKLWSFKKGGDNDNAEYTMQLRNGDLYAMIITEKIQVAIESFVTVALENGRKVAPDLKIVKEEYRMVNGLKVLFLQMNGTIDGIKFTYYGYYYSNANGSVQFVTYTSQKLFSSYQKDCENLLNGIVEIK